MRHRICIAIVTATSCGTVVYRESKEVIRQQLSDKARLKEYNKRHDEFMALGGTRELKSYSDNVAMQIAQFKQSKARVML